mmetsp:Transcript_24171/g.43322  ORF Transcript_24171/g.43322 Transcript_24171/m.43322 type:complete len:256 (+) Transcript_24171:984-1751(+)
MELPVKRKRRQNSSVRHLGWGRMISRLCSSNMASSRANNSKDSSQVNHRASSQVNNRVSNSRDSQELSSHGKLPNQRLTVGTSSSNNPSSISLNNKLGDQEVHLLSSHRLKRHRRVQLSQPSHRCNNLRSSSKALLLDLNGNPSNLHSSNRDSSRCHHSSRDSSRRHQLLGLSSLLSNSNHLHNSRGRGLHPGCKGSHHSSRDLHLVGKGSSNRHPTSNLHRSNLGSPNSSRVHQEEGTACLPKGREDTEYHHHR